MISNRIKKSVYHLVKRTISRRDFFKIAGTAGLVTISGRKIF